MTVRFGVALFANGTPFCREGNFACAHRGQPFPFASVSDLPAQTLWVTNCSLQDLVEVGLHKNPKIAHDGYFRTRLSQMIFELGATELSVEQQSALFAELLGNAAEMAKLQLGLTKHPVRGIAQGVGQLFGSPEPAQGSAVAQIAEQACQRYTTCERERRFEKADVFSFWLPRHEWAKNLLEQPVPGNDNLNLVQPHALPSMGRDPAALVEWATENKIALFARVKILGLEEVIGKLMNYGSGAQNVDMQAQGGGRYSARNLREWCALPELDALCQGGDVQVLQVAVATSWHRSGVHVYQGRIAPVSYSYGLVAENLWAGVTRRPDSSGYVSKSLSTAWLQAVDRMGCMRIAERLYNLGMEVINYGNGRITVACPPSVRALIPQVAFEEGLMYPASLEGLTHYTPRHDNPAHVLQHLISNREYGRLIQVDQALMKSMGATSAA